MISVDQVLTEVLCADIPGDEYARFQYMWNALSREQVKAITEGVRYYLTRSIDPSLVTE